MEPIRIFLSYAHEDYRAVRSLHARLEAEGYRPWIDKVDLLPGEVFAVVIQQVIRKSDFFIICLSSQSVAKRSFLQREINTALDAREEKLATDLYIIPVRLNECEIPDQLKSLHTVDLFGNEAEEEWSKLLRALRKGAKRIGKAPLHTGEMASPMGASIPRAKSNAPEMYRHQPLHRQDYGHNEISPMFLPPIVKAITVLGGLVLLLILVGVLMKQYGILKDISPTKEDSAAPKVISSLAPTPLPSPSTSRPPSSLPTFTENLSNGVKLEMVNLPGGSFTMGAPEKEGWIGDETPHRVTVSSFAIGKFEITQEQWQAVMGITARDQWEKNNTGKPMPAEGSNYPVYAVSWDDAQRFCKILSQSSKRDYQLPTEAEWEYACRARTKEAHAGDLDKMAWYGNNSGSVPIDALDIWKKVNRELAKYRERLSLNKNRPHPVGQKQPNRFGLFDMHGNVLEWCRDWYGPYPKTPQENPTGPKTGKDHVLRGGSWFNYESFCRSAIRYTGEDDDKIGFRVVQSLKSP
ncbi:MAG: SUMF1/EgtB/PvdO family nonheme iron enzyme [Acidobacteria bacterium]|nr:SUMF1/EgtB/PvdO family nonheme iron enzyme [Acidobacteriota bacterium]